MCAFGHLAARVAQWGMVALYLYHFGADILRIAGGGWTLPLLLGPLMFWAWCERFYVKLGFGLSRTFKAWAEKEEREKHDENRLVSKVYRT